LGLNAASQQIFPDRIFINLRKHGAYAFPLDEYPKKADGTYWADFPITYVHLSTYDIPYWDSVN